ncbi:hypothetical protein [Mucilaginibacter phyllosphaerae]
MAEPMLEKKLKHLEFTENVINRMNSNSFAIKGWAVTVVSALFALAAKDTNYKFSLVSYAALLIFWIMDAYFLSQERMYRALYDTIVAQADDGHVSFNMNATIHDTGDNTWVNSFWSKTLLWFYSLFVAITLVVMYLILT